MSTLYKINDVLNSLTTAAEESPLIQSMVQYVAPERLFQKQFPFEDRYREAHRVLEKYPNRIPVICERDPTCSTIKRDNKKKFLIPRSLTLGEFMFVIRKRIKLEENQALFIFVITEKRDGSIGKELAPTSHLIDTIYTQNRNRDAFLYLQYASENTFG